MEKINLQIQQTAKPSYWLRSSQGFPDFQSEARICEIARLTREPLLKFSGAALNSPTDLSLKLSSSRLQGTPRNRARKPRWPEIWPDPPRTFRQSEKTDVRCFRLRLFVKGVSYHRTPLPRIAETAVSWQVCCDVRYKTHAVRVANRMSIGERKQLRRTFRTHRDPRVVVFLRPLAYYPPLDNFLSKTNKPSTALLDTHTYGIKFWCKRFVTFPLKIPYEVLTLKRNKQVFVKYLKKYVADIVLFVKIGDSLK